jgi:hypothetical protein
MAEIEALLEQICSIHREVVQGTMNRVVEQVITHHKEIVKSLLDHIAVLTVQLEKMQRLIDETKFDPTPAIRELESQIAALSQ